MPVNLSSNMKKKEFQYKTRFDCLANFRKDSFVSDSFVSKASIELEDLKKLLPAQEEINDNPDLLYTCFNAAVVNLINANDDGIGTDTGLAIAKKFKQRPMNIDHARYNVVGCITEAGFSSFGDNKILMPEDLAGATHPFNISLASVLWRVVDEYFADFVAESSDPEGWCYKSVSTSWELGFNDYHIVLGSKKLADAEIITDSKKIKELTKYLRAARGTGFMPDGTPVYRLIIGDVMPLGCAYTSNPAAAVQGVAVGLPMDPSEMIELDDEIKPSEDMEEEDSKKKCSSASVLEEKLDSIKKSLEIISHNTITNVTISKSMKFEKLEDIYDNFAEAKVGDVRNLVQVALDDANNKFVALQDEKRAVEQSLIEAAAKTTQTQAELDRVSKELVGIQARLQEQERQEKFNTRMAEVNEKFDVNDAARKVVAKRISDMSDEVYAEWLADEAPVFLPAKTIANLESNASIEQSFEQAQARGFIPNADGGSSANSDQEAERAEKAKRLKESFSLGKGIVFEKR